MSLEYSLKDILTSMNGKKIIIPTLQTIMETYENINGKLNLKSDGTIETIPFSIFQTIIQIKLGAGKLLENVSFQCEINSQNIKGNLKEESFYVCHDNTCSDGEVFTIGIDEKVIDGCDSPYIELPKTFIGQIIRTSIGIMGTLNIGGKEINISHGMKF